MKRLILLSTLFVFAFMAVHAQNVVSQFSVHVVDCNKTVGVTPESPTNIQANFIANKTFGPAPLTVQFQDASQGNPVRWRWFFGDGVVADTENPLHTYTREDIYTVTLTVWDADDTAVYSTVSRADYIRAVGYGACDSVNYDRPKPANYTLYNIEAPGTGYLSGNNSRGDLAKASYFNITEDKGLLMGGLYFFAVKKNGLASDPLITFNAYGGDGISGGPGTILDSDSKLLSEIPVDDQGTAIYPATIAFFDNWVPISDDFYMGFVLPQGQGDTLAIYTKKIGEANNGNGWEQAASGEWRTYEEGNPGYDVGNAIFPIICQPTGIDNHILEKDFIVYPIPANDYIYVNFFDKGITEMEVSIFDLSGREVLNAGTPLSSGTAINVNKLSGGLYIMKISTSEGVVNRKIMVE